MFTCLSDAGVQSLAPLQQVRRLGLVSLLKGLSGCFSKALLFDQTLGDACFAPLSLHIACNQRWDRWQ